MRILVAHARYRVSGGEDRYVRQQVDLLRPRHDVKVVDPSNRDLDSGYGTFGRMLYSRKMVRSMEGEITAFRPDVVHVHNVYPSLGPAVHLAASKLGVPIVMTVHNYRLRCPNGYMFTEGAICRRCTGGNHSHATLHECFPSRRQAAAYASALALHRYAIDLPSRVSMFIAPSRFMADQLQAWGFDSSRVVVIRNFTETSPTRVPLNEARGGLFLGRLSSEKGLGGLLSALKTAGDPEFTIVGDGPERQRLLQSARKLGLERTMFMGRVSHDSVPAIIRSSRYLALPSLWHENAPLAALEAMAAGRPLLVADRGGLPELVEGGAGVMWRPEDGIGALASLIQKLDREDRANRVMGERALDYASTELTGTRHLEQLEATYEAVQTRGAINPRSGARRHT